MDECFECDICKKEFTMERNLNVHKARTHKRPKNAQCEICSKEFWTHMNNIHAPNNKARYSCDVCEKGFTVQWLLKTHFQKVHDNVRMHQCDICDKILSSVTKLERHMNIVHSMSDQTYSCETCKKDVKEKDLLKYHFASSHNNLKTFQCQLCSIKFMNKIDLQIHDKSIHEKNEKYNCDKCDKQFFHRQSYKMHLMIHDSDRKTINCKICGKTYLTKRGLTVHWQTIHENVSFQCEKCDKVSKNMH